jgi:membrane protease YdiL (CAAX protease family)
MRLDFGCLIRNRSDILRTPGLLQHCRQTGVVGAITIVATAACVIDLFHTNWKKAGINFTLVTISTLLVVIVTEEGFFRGWLWASLERAGLQKAGPSRAGWSLSSNSLPGGGTITLQRARLRT